MKDRRVGKRRPPEPLTRRGFLQTAVVGGTVVAASGGAAESGGEPCLNDEAVELMEILERYGSEFGDLRRAD